MASSCSFYIVFNAFFAFFAINFFDSGKLIAIIVFDSVFLIADRFFRQRPGVKQHLFFLIAGVQILKFEILIATVNLDSVFKVDRLSKLAFRIQTMGFF